MCVCTYQFLVAAVQCHVTQSGGDGADYPVVVHPQQLHQDGKALLLTHRCSDVGRKLQKKKQSFKCPERSQILFLPIRFLL